MDPQFSVSLKEKEGADAQHFVHMHLALLNETSMHSSSVLKTQEPANKRGTQFG